MARVTDSDPIRLAVLISGGGTTLLNLIDQISAKRLHARIDVVVASKPGIKGIDHARAAGLPTTVLERKAFGDADQFSTAVFEKIDPAGIDLIVLAGWLCLLKIPPQWTGKMMNIHPALLPSFGGPGMYGQRVHQAVIDHGCRVSGATVHFVDHSYDTGPIILQQCCPVHDTDTPAALAARVFEVEKSLYPQAIELYRQGRLRIDRRRVMISDR